MHDLPASTRRGATSFAAAPAASVRLPALRRAALRAVPARRVAHACACACGAHADGGAASTSGRGLAALGQAPLVNLHAAQRLQQQRPQKQQQPAPQQHGLHHHHCDVHAAPEAAHAAAAGALPPPFAALTRLLLTGQNSYYFRNALTARRIGGGPISLLLFVLTLLAAVFAAVRGALVRKVKACRTCRGFGVTRCRLCGGTGRVDWAAKLSHCDVCPLCMNRRYVVCSECGGFYHRPLFRHVSRSPRRSQAGQEAYAFDAGAAATGSAVFSMQESIGSTRND